MVGKNGKTVYNGGGGVMRNYELFRVITFLLVFGGYQSCEPENGDETN